jgi:hypothetical protein
MKLLTVLAATAAAAAVAAAITIPAGAADQGDGASVASCMRAHGAAVPAGVAGLALKMWIHDHIGDDNVDSALAACTPDDASPAPLVSCLKAHGVNAPASNMALKPFLANASRNAQLKAALKACGVVEDKGSDQSAKDLAACLSSHGASGVPDGSDPVALKQWIGAHADAAADALKACDVGVPDEKKPAAAAAAGCAAPAPAGAAAAKNSSE